MDLRNKILELRKKSGLSLEEMAEKLNVSRQTISRWEVGTAQPDAGNLRQLSLLFGVTADYLLNDNSESPDDFSRTENPEKNPAIEETGNRKLFLIAAIAFFTAAIAFLVAGFYQLDSALIAISIVNAVLAGIFVFRHKTG